MQINMLQNKCKDDVVKQSSIFLFTLKLCYEKLSVGELFLPDTVFFWHFLMRQWFHQELLAFQNFVILRKY